MAPLRPGRAGKAGGAARPEAAEPAGAQLGRGAGVASRRGGRERPRATVHFPVADAQPVKPCK